MGFKLLGITLLLFSTYLVVNALLLVERLQNEPVRAEVYAAFAIVLSLMVRVLQAEKHHREKREP